MDNSDDIKTSPRAPRKRVINTESQTEEDRKFYRTGSVVWAQDPSYLNVRAAPVKNRRKSSLKTPAANTADHPRTPPNTPDGYTADNGSTPPSAPGSNATEKPMSRMQKLKSEWLTDFHHFRVLMWMLCILRRRRWVLTTVELLAPCFVLFGASLMVAPFKSIMNKPPKNETALSLNEFNEILLDGSPGPRILMYHPRNLFTDELMEYVAKDLNLKLSWVLPVDNSSRVYYGYPESFKPAVYYLAKTTDGSAIVEFQGTDDLWPDSLNYTIKMRERYKNDYEENMENLEDLGELQITDKDFRSLMRLQRTIDTNYLKMWTNFNDNGLRTTQYVPPIYLSKVPEESNANTKHLQNHVGVTSFFMFAALLIAPILPFVFFVSRLMEERGSGVQELVKQAGVSYTVMATGHGCNNVLMGLTYSSVGIICFSVFDLYPKQFMFILFVTLWLQYHSVMSFAYLCSFINRSGSYAAGIAMGFYMAMNLPYVMCTVTKIPKYAWLPLALLFPNVSQNNIFNEVTVGLLTQQGIKSVVKAMMPQLSVMLAFTSMCIQIFLILLVSDYLNEVRPGKYGTRKPCFYMCKKRDGIAPLALEEIEEEIQHRDPKFFENSGLQNVGIQIENVSKIYGRNIVLSNVTFDVYHGEITVLLGHNGAGKTTLMSIITSSLSATTGRVFVNGNDIASDKSKQAKAMIGTCTQHNTFFSRLTVMEHVRLFAMLRGHNFKQSKASSHYLLTQLGLQEKLKNRASELSGGMQRRLQLACALAGDCKVLILDEPTSGLDVETRRELWTLLMSLRGDKTILLTTHFMEEADALGDRVAALNNGRLKCHASPMYLKKNVGTGYRVTLTTQQKIPKETEITETIQKVIPTATVKESSLHSISYNLPSQEIEEYATVFKALEDNKENLGIESIGVGSSSLEEVFMALCSDTETQHTTDYADTKMAVPYFQKIKGVSLYINQMKVLIIRQVRFIWANKIRYLFMSLLVPAMMFVIWTFICKSLEGNMNKGAPRSDKKLMNPTYPSGNTILLHTAPHYKEIAKKLTDSYKNVNFEFSDDISKKLLRTRMENLTKYNLGIDIHDIHAKVIYTPAFRKSVPMAVNLISNILATVNRPDYDGKTITTNYEPLMYDPEEKLPVPLIKNPTTEEVAKLVVVGIMLFFTLGMVSCANLPVLERKTSIRHIYMMAGVPPLLHWLATWLSNLVLYAFVLFPMALVFVYADKTSTFTIPAFVGAMIFLLLFLSLVFLLVCYLFSCFMSRMTVELVTLALNLFVGCFLGMTYYAKGPANSIFTIILYNIATIAYYFYPVTTAMVAGCKLSKLASLNAMCVLNKDKCRKKLQAVMSLARGFDFEACCLDSRDEVLEGPQKFCYLCYSAPGIGKEIVLLVVHILFYGSQILLIHYGVYNYLSDRILNFNYKPNIVASTDPNIVNEDIYVEQQMASSAHKQGDRPDAMLVHKVHKRYNKCCKSMVAVQGVSLSIKKGECFGLLGVNGAGKTTAFKMIVAEEVPTKGKISANGVFRKWIRNIGYMKRMSHCPQFGGLDMHETGYKNIVTRLMLRGFNLKDANDEADIWINIVGLNSYRNLKVEDYSGGCLRRLACAASLAIGAPVTLLDEPTSGVDVAARRRVWVALKRGLRDNRAVIITSHSMDEMEALCDRIAIMVDGRVAALGSAPALRAAHAMGHSLSIKLTPGVHQDDINVLKETLASTFDCTLVDERATLLQYHINIPMNYSVLFSTLENLKKSFEPSIIEDYSISETTLEEVFLSFAKKP